MSDLHVFEAFHDELDKLALDTHALLGSAAGGAGAGAMLGAAGGALVGGVRRYRQARREGAGVGQGLLASTGGALSGAGKGALVGAGGGAALGAAAPRLMHSLPAGENLLGASARFGQRQLHGLTGWLPTRGDSKSIEAIRGGAFGARKSFGALQGQLEMARAKGLPTEGLERTVGRAAKELGAQETAQGLGLTSIPGTVRALRKDAPEALRASAAQQWHGGGLASKALLVGVPALSTAQAIGAKEQPTGPGKGERIGREIASTLGGLATAPLPLASGMLAGGVIGGVGARVGRGVDRLRGRKPIGELAANPENVRGQHVPTERVMTPSAQGQPPEMMT